MAPPVHFAQNSDAAAKPDGRKLGPGTAGMLVIAAAAIVLAATVIVESAATPAQRDALFQTTHVYP